MEPAKTTSDQVNGAKVCIIGNVDSGKSTLVGVLTKGMNDDGRGLARTRVFNYAHEMGTGRTSSVAQEIMGFDAAGNQKTPERFNQNKNKYWAEVVKMSSKIVTLIDLCGHEKYLKTTMFGMVGFAPDYGLIVVGANYGLAKMTKEHLGISIALELPFFIVITKIDMAPAEKIKETENEINKIFKPGCSLGRVSYAVSSKEREEELAKLASETNMRKLVPIFKVSSVTGEGIDKLVKFLYLLNPRITSNPLYQGINDPVEFDLHEHFSVAGVGLVVSGVMKAGTAKIGSVLMFGPDQNNQFRPVTIRGIHVNRVPVSEAYAGQYACFAIKAKDTKRDEIERKDIRKGMVLLDTDLKVSSAMKFDAEIQVLHNHTTIKMGYQGVLHCGIVRQAVKLVGSSKEILRTGDKASVTLEFIYAPEFLKENSTILLREGRTKILGKISKVYPLSETVGGKAKENTLK